ncbi:MAG: hypothetical protein R3A47_10275 [Polyangiales bacterium]
MAALEKLVARKEIKRGDRAVVISTANGLKFTQFKIRYHENKIEGVTSRFPNVPLELPNDFEAVKSGVFKALEQRRSSL